MNADAVVTSLRDITLTSAALAPLPDQQNGDDQIITCILTADIDNLYPSMPVDEIRTLAREAFCAAGEHACIELWMSLFLVQLLCNDVCHAGQWYRQVRGVAQGVSWAPAIANLFMMGFDAIVNNFPEVRRYWRYIDDVCIIWQGTSPRLLAMQQELRLWRPANLTVRIKKRKQQL